MRVVSAFARFSVSISARVRSAAGVWGDTRTLDVPHLADSEPLIATDGHGHFATATSPDAGGLQPVDVSFLDMAPPAVAPVALSGSAEVGAPLTMRVVVRAGGRTVELNCAITSHK